MKIGYARVSTPEQEPDFLQRFCPFRNGTPSDDELRYIFGCPDKVDIITGMAYILNVCSDIDVEYYQKFNDVFKKKGLISCNIIIFEDTQECPLSLSLFPVK